MSFWPLNPRWLHSKILPNSNNSRARRSTCRRKYNFYINSSIGNLLIWACEVICTNFISICLSQQWEHMWLGVLIVGMKVSGLYGQTHQTVNHWNMHSYPVELVHLSWFYSMSNQHAFTYLVSCDQLTQLMLFTFWLLRMVNQPEFSLEPVFIIMIDSIHISRATQEYVFPVQTYHSPWMQLGERKEYQALWGNQEDTYLTCHYHRFSSKETWAWVRTWTLPSCLFLWHDYFESKHPPIPWRISSILLFRTPSKSLKRVSTRSLCWVLFSSSAYASASSCALMGCWSLARQAVTSSDTGEPSNLLSMAWWTRVS